MTEFKGFTAQAVQKKAKNGNDYICIEICFPNGYKKLVFLEEAEKYMLLSMIENFGKE